MGYIRDRWKDPARKGKGQRWQVKYRVDGREKDGGSFDNKDVAKRTLIDLESAVQRGQWIDPGDRTTVAEYAREWAAARPYRASTRRRVDSQIRRYLDPEPIGARRLASVRPSEVQMWSAKLAQTLAPSTVATVVNMLKAMYATALLDRLVASSPVVRISLPRADQERVIPLTVDQVRALADVVPPQCRAMVITQAGLGLRIGELLALRVQDVDFLRRTARVEHQLERGTRARVDPKTPRSRRTVPLPAFVAAELAEHLRSWPSLADGSLFYAQNGRPYDHTMYGTKVFKRAVEKMHAAHEKAAAEARSGRKSSEPAPAAMPLHTTPHDLRHAYASWLLAGGESVVAVAERLGHDNATMVLKVYGHLMPDAEDHTRRVVEAAWSSLPRDAATAQALPG